MPEAAWPQIKAMVVEIREAPNAQHAKEQLDRVVALHSRQFPEACRCLQDDWQASLNHLHVPMRHRPLVRTTNLVERAFVEERRRTEIIPHLWDEHSAVKRIFAVLPRVSHRWSKRQFSQFEQHEVRRLRMQILGTRDTDSSGAGGAEFPGNAMPGRFATGVAERVTCPPG